MKNHALCRGLFCLLTASAAVSSAQALFKDGFESDLAAWQAQGGWSRSAQSAHEGNWSVNDSPNAYYDNNTDSSLALAGPLDFSTLTRPAVSFYHRHALEEGYDFGQVEASSNGTDWVRLSAYTGNQAAWTYEQLGLDSFAGMSAVWLRFRMVTDDSIVKDGWYVDSVAVGERPPAPMLSVLAQTNPPGVYLNWSLTPGAGQYVVLRAMTSNFNWRAAVRVGTLGPASTNLLDVTVSPKTTYYYRLLAATDAGLHALSPEQSVTTPVTMDFPFLDSCEGGSARWNSDPPWALSDEASASPTHAWTESAGGFYGNNLNSSLTLARRLDMTGARAPGLTFRHQYAFESGDLGLVEASANNGADWTELGRYTAGISTGIWTWQRYSLAAFTNSSQVLVRFRVTSNSSGVNDGWRVDDIGLGEMPDAVATPVVDEVRSYSVRLSWPASTHDQFSHYLVYRSASPGVSLSSIPVAVVTNQGTPGATADGLAMDTPYYFRVYQVSRYGIISPEGGEILARTLNNPIPFADDFEGGLTHWLLTGSWGLGTNGLAAGHFLGDSPDASYAASRDTTADLSVDLRNTQWPVLTFKDRFAIGNGDWMRLDVYAPEVGWAYPYGAGMGSRTNWEEQVIDLSPFKGLAKVTLRFHVATDGDPGTVADGWNVDDVQVEELEKTVLPYPFHEYFEEGFGTNWLNGGWTIGTNESFEGRQAAWDTPVNQAGPSVSYHLMPAGTLNLSNAVNPQLTFRVKGISDNYSFVNAYVSEDGIAWSSFGLSLDYSFNTAGWVRRQLDLTPWTGKSIRLQFTVGTWNVVNEDVQVDRIVVSDRPAGVSMLDPVPYLKSGGLSWTAASNGASFLRYELYRSPDPTVTIEDALLATRTATNQTAFTDTGLNIGQTYYYGVFVVDTNELYSPVSMRAMTTVPQVLPLVDPMNTLANWDAMGDWGPDTLIAREGAVTIGDSPGGAYTHNRDTYIQTAVNLLSAQWPVLRFKDRYSLEAGDWLRVDISSDGSGWTPVYGYCEGSRTNWEDQVLDLSPWKGNANVRIRFRVATDNNPATVAEGWNLSDLKVEELTPAPIAYPFFEYFENGFETNWLNGGWTVRTNEAFEGRRAAWDTSDSRAAPDVNYWLTLAGVINLSNAVNPQLTFRVKGYSQSYSFFNVHISENGVNWSANGMGFDYNFNTAGWERRQLDLTPWIGKAIRLRFNVNTWGAPAEDVRVDRVVVRERPVGVSMLAPAAYLKSADLSWTAASNGVDFLRYELYRSPDANVTIDDILLTTRFETNQTAFTDTGLNIGQTYYYGVFVVDTNEMYSTVSMRAVTTIPKRLPVIDPMDDLSAWDVTGDWGSDSVITRDGAVTIGDSPGGAYIHNRDSAIQTSVDLRTITWPVLRFKDRYSLGAGDWFRLEISSDGGGWSQVYGYCEGSRTNWEEQAVDLSPWKGNANVRIKFRIWTDNNAGTVEEGWNLDDLRVEELQQTTPSYPFADYFESGFASNWLHAGWTLRSNDVFEGQWAAWDSPESRAAPDVTYYMMPAGLLNLSHAVNPQLVFRVKANSESYSFLNIYVSEDGVNWTGYGLGLDYNFNTAGWVRRQVDLSSWAGKAIRLRFNVNTWGPPAEDIQIDSVVVLDRPSDVVLSDPAAHLKTVDLAWAMASNGAAFARYELYRSPDATVTIDDLKVATKTLANDTAFTDTGLPIGSTWYYGIFVVDTNGCYSAVNSKVAVMVPHTLPTAGGLDSLDAWDATGAWGVDPLVTFEGEPAIGDSPGGAYNASRDTSIQTYVDLRGTTWPVLRFNDRYALTNGDWLRLEIYSPQAGWGYMYSYYEGARTNWEEQVVDLSPWRGNPNVLIRFRVVTDGDPATVADGWTIASVNVEEHQPASIPYPFYEDFETGFGSNWLHAGWTLRTNDAYEGRWLAWDSPESHSGPDVQYWLETAGWINLTNATDSQLVFWLKAQTDNYGFFRVHVTENGINWTELPAVNLDYNFNINWTRKNVPLAAYAGKSIRLRFFYSNWGITAENIKLDRIGIGGTTPGTPVPRSPINGESTPMSLPVLTVRNAIDFQGDPLTYRFEVFTDSNLTAKVAEVPAVAENSDGTSWRVDTELSNNRQYWWRCQVSDGGTTGAWSRVATFFVNRGNTPPTAPVLLAPSDRAQEYRAAAAPFIWTASVETQAEDAVTAYQVQLATDPAFGSPLADTNVAAGSGPAELHTLGEITPTNALALTHWYYWRVRALDAWGAWSDWSQTNAFILAEPPPGGSGTPPDYPLIRLSAERLTTACTEGESPSGMAFSLQNRGAGSLEYTIGDDKDWLSVTPASGSSIGEWDPVILHFDASGLAGGVYTATVSVVSGTASNSPCTLSVVLTVAPVSVSEAPRPLEPALEASLDPADELAFAWTAVERASNYWLFISRDGGAWSTNVLIVGGQSTGLTVEADFDSGVYAWQVCGENERGSGPVSAARLLFIGITNSLRIDSPWGNPDPIAGEHRYRRGTVVTASVESVQVDGFTTYACLGWIGTGVGSAAGAGTRLEFAVTQDVVIAWQWSTNTELASAVQVSASALGAQATEGVGAPNGQFLIRNGGAGVLNWTAESDAWWLTPVPASGTSTGEWDAVTLVYQADSLLYGAYQGRVTVTDPSVPIEARAIDVTLGVLPNQLPAQPELLNPLEGDWLPVTGAVRFAWRPATRASDYRVWIGKDGAAFTNILTGGPQTNLVVEALFHRGLYTWFAHGINHLGAGPWSTTATFRVEREMSPEGGLPSGVGSLRFSWNPTPGATAYRLVLERYLNTPAGVWAGMQTQTVAAADWMPDGLLFPAGAYRWSLQEERESAWQAPEPLRYFQVGVPAQPVPLAPGGVLYRYKAVPFFWTPAEGADTYQIQVKKGVAAYSNSVWLGATQLTVRLSPTAAAYTWRVRAQNSDGPGAWSPYLPLTFKTLAAPKPVAPMNSIKVGSRPVFKWKASPGAEGYILTVANAASGVKKTYKTGAVTQYQPVKGLARGAYTWQVKATNPDQASPASAPALFVVP